MEKPPRLKVDTEIVTNEDDSASATASGVLVPAPADDANFTGEPVPETADRPPVKAAPITRDLQAERDAKKREEQEFLAAYKKRELFVRVRFVIIAVLLIGGFQMLAQNLLKTDRRAAVTGFFVSPAILSAFAGERDAVYYQISAFPFGGDESKKAALLNSRQAILDKEITNLESSGRAAIFTRLGIERMLVNQGLREKGLAYGDVLIKKYPDLPSNYAWRAKTDFDRGDYANAITEYHQFADLVKTQPLQVQKSWRNEFRTAVWACVNAGHYDEAEQFLNYMRLYAVPATQLQGLRSAILFGRYDHLDLPQLQRTDFWNANLDQVSKKLLQEANQQTRNMTYMDDDKDSISFDVALRSRNFAQMQRALKAMRPYKWLRYQYVVGKAQMELAKGDPQQALATMRTKLPDQVEMSSAELDYLTGVALIRLHRFEEALPVIESGFEWYQTPGALTGKFFLPFYTLKAQAFDGLGHHDEALKICEQAIKGNPKMIAPRLLKMEILQGQGQKAQAAEVHAQIAALLEAFESEGIKQ